MANTAHSQISAGTVISGTPMIKWSNLASTYKPADWVYFTAAVTATHLDSDVAICNFGKPFQLEYKPRIIGSTMARKDCDDTYLAADLVPVILGSRVPAFITTIAKVTDPSGTKYAGHAFMASATAGDIDLMADWTASTSFYPRIRYIINGFNPDTIVSSDTYMKFVWS